MSETIFAPLNSTINSSVCVVRISGKKVKYLIEILKIRKTLVPNCSVFTPIYDGDNLLDKALVTYFQSPISFTGEDVLEISIHASKFILDRLLQILAKIDGFRYAKNGEFSYRAFMNSKISLTEAEGIASLISSQTQIQHKIAMQEFSGEINVFYADLYNQILGVLGLVECLIDFAEDQDVDFAFLDTIKAKIKDLQLFVKDYLNKGRLSKKLKKGIEIAIYGKPNVGKSSLINLLSNQDISIVSPYAGTTRDILSVGLDIGGFPVTLYDTAGIRDSADPVEQIGIEKAIKKAQESDLRICLVDVTDDSTDNLSYDILVVNKADIKPNYMRSDGIVISIKDKLNINKLLNEIEARVKQLYESHIDNLFTMNERQESLLNQVLARLEMSLNLLDTPEICAEELRQAGRFIEEILGRKIDTEDILGLIFGKFCIGK